MDIQTVDNCISDVAHFSYKLQFFKSNAQVNYCLIFLFFLINKSRIKCSFTIKFQYNFKIAQFKHKNELISSKTQYNMYNDSTFVDKSVF